MRVGSQIDPGNPGAAATRLHPSQTDYCGMLGQTLRAGKSLIAGVQDSAPGLRLGVQAFVPEIEKVAPTGIAGQWLVLGPAVLAIAQSGSAPSAGADGTTARALQSVSVIADDAKSRCGLDLTPLITGVTGG